MIRLLIGPPKAVHLRRKRCSPVLGIWKSRPSQLIALDLQLAGDHRALNPPMIAILVPSQNHFLSERFFAFFAFFPDSSPAEGLGRGMTAPVSERHVASCALNDFTRSGF
jgi:hypothetical protein